MAVIDSEERWMQLIALDEEMLKGSSMLSEWCSFIVRESDIAFAEGAHLASILTAVSAIETYLRSEYALSSKENLFKLIEESPITDSLKRDLQMLRKYRNKWVHVSDPWDDQNIILHPERFEAELEEMAFFAARCLRKTIHENQWV